MPMDDVEKDIQKGADTVFADEDDALGGEPTTAAAVEFPEDDDSEDDPMDLGAHDEQYQASEAAERGGTVPDGKYQARIEKIELAESQKGTPMLKWVLKIIGPTQAGRTVFRNSMITDRSIDFLKTDLLTCGIKLGSLKELYAHNKNFIGPRLIGLAVEIQVKTKKGEDMPNIYLNALIKSATGSTEEIAGATELDLEYAAKKKSEEAFS